MSTQEVNLDDPNSWPSDIESLARMAAGQEPDGAAPDSGVEEPVEAKEEEAKAEEPEAKTEEAKAEEPEAKAEEPEQKEEEELPISTKDGKGTIPYSALAAARKKEQEARARLEELEAQLAEQQSGKPESERATPTEFVVTDEMKAKADKLREEWGDEIADMYLENQETKHRLAYTTQELTSLREVSSKTAESQKRSEEQKIQDAIDASPQMAEWQNAEDTEMFEKSIAMHQFLLNTDAAYAAMDWKDRFAELPKRVSAAYGIATPATETPAPESTASKDKSSETEMKAKADKAKKLAEESTPKTMSDLPKGESPVETEETDRLEKMGAHEIQAMMDKMTPAELEKYLSAVM